MSVGAHRTETGLLVHWCYTSSLGIASGKSTHKMMRTELWFFFFMQMRQTFPRPPCIVVIVPAPGTFYLYLIGCYINCSLFSNISCAPPIHEVINNWSAFVLASVAIVCWHILFFGLHNFKNRCRAQYFTARAQSSYQVSLMVLMEWEGSAMWNDKDVTWTSCVTHNDPTKTHMCN